VASLDYVLDRRQPLFAGSRRSCGRKAQRRGLLRLVPVGDNARRLPYHMLVESMIGRKNGNRLSDQVMRQTKEKP